MRRIAAYFCFFLILGHSVFATDFKKDAQLCINAYNHLWWAFESGKSEFRHDPIAQLEYFHKEFKKVLDPDIELAIINLPLPPDYQTLISITKYGLTEVENLAQQTSNWGEHHVATPFSIKRLSADRHGTAVYLLTTRDVDYTRDPDTESGPGGITVYLSQKDVTCTVKNGPKCKRKAVINKVIDNVVAAYRIPASDTGVWTTPPVTNYIDASTVQ